MQLTHSEMEIMELFWSADRPLSRVDILKNPAPRSWKDSSIHILLNGMLQKKVIREAGHVKHGKTFGRTFLPAVTREQYFAKLIYSYDRKPDPVKLISEILKQDNISDLQLQQLSDLIQKRVANKF